MLTNANTAVPGENGTDAERAVYAAARLAMAPDTPTGERTADETAAPLPTPAPAPQTQPDLPVQDKAVDAPLFPELPASVAAAGSIPLANPQHELFCEHVTGWGGDGEPSTGMQAYKTVYGCQNDATARVNASRLTTRQDVRERCAWMRAQLASSIMLDKRAIRAQLYNMRMGIIEKTKGTKDRGIALEAARDVERSLGLDKPEIEKSTTVEGTEAEAIAARVGKNIEALAAALVGRSVTTRTTINE